MLRRRQLLVLCVAPLGALSSGVLPMGCAPRPPPAREPLPLSAQVDPATRAAMRRVPITMYMTTWCPHCRRGRTWLERGGYTFQMLDVDRDERAADVLEAINPRGAVPTFDVDGTVVFGFRPRELESTILRVARARMQTAVR